MVDTALTLITDSLLDLGVIADEEVPTASQAAGGLRKLNNMLDSWNLDTLLVYGSMSQDIPLVPGQGVYTIGPGGDVNIPRPTKITGAFVRDITLPAQQQQDIWIDILTDQEWQSVSFKAQQSQYPFNGIWFDQTNPLIQAYINPVPTTSQYKIVFWSSGMIGNLVLSSQIILPPGYKRAIGSNLCKELAPSFEVTLSKELEGICTTSLAAIKLNNFQLNELQIDPVLTHGRYYDIQTNRYR